MAFISSGLIHAIEWSIKSKRKIDKAKRMVKDSKITLKELAKLAL